MSKLLYKHIGCFCKNKADTDLKSEIRIKINMY